jgi:predicted GTPase
MNRLRLRILLIGIFFLAPVAFLMGAGAYHLWITGWGFAAWWPMAGSFLLAYYLAYRFTKRREPKLAAGTGTPDVPSYWTDRDREAWASVQSFSEHVPAPTTDEISDMNRYARDAQALAIRVTHHYRPHAKDPFSHLTLPEILACGELIAHDLARLVNKYVPGSHAITVNNFKQMRQAADWYERGRNAYWLVSALIDPVRAGLQIAATKAGLQTTFRQVQKNVVSWFYTAYLLELGRYLIELNSGRLKVGTRRYLELMELHEAPPADPDAPAGAASPPGARADAGRLVVAIVGPVKAGKSSLVNAIFGDELAGVDSLPLTPAATRYDLNTPGLQPLSIIDTAGFGQYGANDADVEAAIEVAAESDLLLVVVPARSAARQPEVEFLDRVTAGFAARPNLRMPPRVGVLSHIDALTPAMEWAPPYDWAEGNRTKEVSIREALIAAKETFGPRVDAFVPVCTAPGRAFGVEDGLLAAMAAKLPEARGVALLRTLHREAQVDRTKLVVEQAINAGREVLKAVFGKKP